MFVRDQEILIADIYSAVCSSLLNKNLYTNCFTSYFGIIPTSKVKYILGIFVTSTLSQYVQFILAVVNEWVLCRANGTQERLGRRKEKTKPHLAFLLCKHTSFLVRGCFLFPLPALTCNLTAEAVSWSMKVSGLWLSLSPFPWDYCNLLVLKLRINQPFLVMFLKNCGNCKHIVCRTHSHKPQSFPEKLHRAVRQNGILFLNSCFQQALQKQT